MKTLSVFFLVLATAALAAADLTTKSGDVYKDFSIIKVYRSGVIVSCAEGIVSVPLSDLPDDLREKYAPQVEEFRKKREKGDAARRKHAAVLSEARKITLSGIGVSNFKVIDSQKQVIVLYKNDIPCHICIADIPFTVFEKIDCLTTDEFRAEVMAVNFHFPNRIEGTLQFAVDGVRVSKTVKASARNKHGFITLQPKLKRDMEKIYAE